MTASKISDARPRRLLLVCYGNLCRSPMAAAMLGARLPAEQWQVSSAGTNAVEGNPPTELAQAVAKELEGLDLSTERSRSLTVDDLLGADQILTMSRVQALEVVALAPEVADRTRLMGAFFPGDEETQLAADPGRDPADPEEIGDPMGGELDTYRECYRRLAAAADVVAAWLLAGAEGASAPPPAKSWIRFPRDREGPTVVIRYVR